MIRNYLYFDRRKIERYLSSLDKGLIRSKRQITQKKGRKISGKVGPFSGEKGSIDQTTDELKDLTDVALFQRLEQLLIEKNDRIIKFPDEQNSIESLMRKMKRGDLIHIDGVGELSALDRILNIMVRFLPALPQMKDFPEKSKLVETLTGDYVSIKITTLNPKEITFFVVLNKKFIEAEIEDFNDEYEIFGRIKRVLRKNDSFNLYSLTGGLAFPEQSLIQFIDILEKNPLTAPTLGINKIPKKDDLILKYPAVQVEPVAIYW